MADARTNWAGNLAYGATTLHRPTSVEAVQELVARTARLKVLGTRHSFNDIADTPAEQVSLEHLNRIVGLDRAARTVTIEGGVRYGELGAFLHREGFALPNLASLPHISVAGAVATATHGSGDQLGNLATAVVAVDMVAADGTLQTFSRRDHPADFPGVVVGLGALGVVTRLTLAVEPARPVMQLVLENLDLSAVLANFDAITGRATSVSLFTDWQADRFHQWWLKQRIDEAQAQEPAAGWRESAVRFGFGATAAATDLHPIPGHAAEFCTPQGCQPGPWHERLPHFRLEFTPSSGAELQTEYFVPRAQATAALAALFGMRTAIAPHILVTEVRTIAADDLWLSPCCDQASVAIHFTWKPDWPAVRALLPTLEAVLESFAARPHWGKLFTMSPRHLRAQYPRLHDFQRLRTRLDPTDKFGNAFLETLLFS